MVGTLVFDVPVVVSIGLLSIWKPAIFGLWR